MANGPANPSRLPIELTTAMPAAAAAPDRKAVGRVQNTGRQEKMPNPATQKGIIFSVGSSSIVEAAIPAAAMNSGIAVCQRRSPAWSERNPHQTIAIVPTAYGSAE